MVVKALLCIIFCGVIFCGFDFKLSERWIFANPAQAMVSGVNDQIGSNRLLIVKDIKPIKLNIKEKHLDILFDVSDNITSASSRYYNICIFDGKFICAEAAISSEVWNYAIIALSGVSKIGVVNPPTSSDFTGYFATPRWGLPIISHPHSKPDIIPANRITSDHNTKVSSNFSLAYSPSFKESLSQVINTTYSSEKGCKRNKYHPPSVPRHRPLRGQVVVSAVLLISLVALVLLLCRALYRGFNGISTEADDLYIFICPIFIGAGMLMWFGF